MALSLVSQPLKLPFPTAGGSTRWQSKPWAHRRYRQRGSGVPWAAGSDGIAIELGSETWQNGVFEDRLGYNSCGRAHQGGREYGLFCRYLIEQRKQSPYRQSEDLSTKVRYNLGGNYDGRVEEDKQVRGYGEEAIAACPEATALGHTNHVGPKWETRNASADTLDDHGLQETLPGFLAGPEASEVKMMQAREALGKPRPDPEFIAYEGGPDGCALPGRDSPQQRETNEHCGRSPAMAVAALDGRMRSYRDGCSNQSLFGYGQGDY